MKEKQKIIVLQGPPASGKSTWAQEFIQSHNNYVIVSRDAERIASGRYNHNYENCISEIEISNAKIWLSNGYSIISDSMNLKESYIEFWKKLANEFKVDIEFKKFFIPLEDAINRDANENRNHHVGKKFLISLYKKYYNDDYKRAFTDNRGIIDKNIELPNCIISDMDATYALHDGRHPFEWDKLNTDKEDWRMHELYKQHYNNGSKIIFITGRPESVREETEKWINEHGGHIDFEYELYMKPDKDCSMITSLFKIQIYEEYIKNNYNVLCVYEDSERCVNAFREKGLLVLQPEKNN